MQADRLLPPLWRVLAIISALAAAAWPSHAAQLRGNVVAEDSGDPLPYANVVVLGTGYGAVTRSDGSFEVQLPAGRYEVRATYISYAAATQTVQVGDAGARLRFKLKPQASVAEDIVVFGERDLVDVKQTSTRRKVDSEAILSMPVDEVQSVVGRQVGVSMFENDVHIRGGRHTEAVFVVDGVVVKDYVSGQSRAGDLSSRSVAQVEVLTGGYSAEYGQALSGVVNVKTREGGNRHSGYLGWTTDHPLPGWDGFRSDIATAQFEGPLFRDDSPELPGGLRLPGNVHYFVELQGRLSDTYLPGSSERGPARQSSYQDSFLGKVFDYGTNLSTRAENTWQLLGKLTWKLSRRDKLAFSLNKSLNINSGFFYRPIIRRDPNATTTYPWRYANRLDHYLTFTEDKAVLSGTWTHHFNENTFQDFRVSRFFTNDHQSVNGKSWFDYEEPDDLAQLENDHPYFIETGDFGLWHDHSVEEIAFDWDLTTRRDAYTWKMGLEHSAQNVQFIDIQEPWKADPDGLGGRHDLYHVHPQVGAGYLQNTFEYQGLVASVGLRADYWYPGPQVDRVILDLKRPSITQQRQDRFYDETIDIFGRRVKARLSPRVSVSHPITERDHLFYNYGRFSQWPSYFYVYSKIGSVSSEAFPLIGNPNLNPEISSQFEFGGAHAFDDQTAANITFFFKDQYDYAVATRVSKLGQGDFFIYTNGDYARARGIELELKRRPTPRLGATVGYTFSISTGRSSDPNENQEIQESDGATATVGLDESPMWWNRPHKLTASVEYNIRRGDTGAKLPFTDWALPSDLYMHLFYRVRSGRAYTPEDTEGVRIGERYSRNAPFEHTVDLKVRKNWRLGTYRLNGTFEVRNLFDARIPRRIDPSTGRALTAGQGQYAMQPTEESSRLYDQAVLANPSNFQSPRQTRLGVGLSW